MYSIVSLKCWDLFLGMCGNELSRALVEKTVNPTVGAQVNAVAQMSTPRLKWVPQGIPAGLGHL